jgi:hypothetical protein
MFWMIFGLALYLIACARWAKHLEKKGATLGRRQAHGVLSVVLVMAMPFLFGGDSFSYAWSAICAGFGYLTIVYRPKWIVGNR